MGPPNSSPRRGGGTSSAASRKRKKSGGICCTLSLNSLWSIWYCSLAVALQLYIVSRSIKSFGQYISLPWPIDDQPYLELNAYVGFVGAAIVLMPFFIATAVLRIGNYPNDGRKVSSMTSPLKAADHAVYQNVRTRGKEFRWTRAIWRHLGPTAAFLHVASAFCLLLPKIFIQAQLVRHGFVKRSELWTSELDFIATHNQRLVSLSLLSTVNESELMAHEASKMEQFPTQHHLAENSASVSAEFINFGISLLVYAVRYPSVYWDSSKSFGFLFSFQLFLNGIQQLIAIAGFGILYKVHVYGPAAALVRFSPLMQDLTTTVMLFFLYNMAMTATSCCLYAYGLQKHREWAERQVQRHHITWRKERWRLWGYTPHVSAFVVLVVLASAAAPLAYDFTLVYCGSLDGVILAAVTSTVAHLFLWILLWLFLTVKQRWKFEEKRSNGRKNSRLRSDSRAVPCNGHVPRETADAELAKLRESRGDAPLLVVDSGNTYQIREKSCRKAILSLATQSISRQKNSSSTDDEDIYWLKPRPPSPKVEPADDEDGRTSTWMRSRKRSPTSSKPHKVTFEEALLNSCPTNKRKNSIKSPKHPATKNRKGGLKIEDFSETASEDGDYATLTHMPAADDREESRGLMSLCLLGESGVAAVERHDRVVKYNLHQVPPYWEAGTESIRSTDSGAESISRSRHITLQDRGSMSSDSPGKFPDSDTSSGIYSGRLSSLAGPEERNNLDSMDKTSLNASISTHQSVYVLSGSAVTVSDINSSTDQVEPTAAILRKPCVLTCADSGSKDKRSCRGSDIKLTSFTEIPSPL